MFRGPPVVVVVCPNVVELMLTPNPASLLAPQLADDPGGQLEDLKTTLKLE